MYDGDVYILYVGPKFHVVLLPPIRCGGGFRGKHAEAHENRQRRTGRHQRHRVLSRPDLRNIRQDLPAAGQSHTQAHTYILTNTHTHEHTHTHLHTYTTHTHNTHNTTHLHIYIHT